MSRLVQASLGRLGKAMAGVPADAPEVEMQDAPQDEAPAAGQGQQQQQGAAGGGGGKKKKKGKK